MAAERRSIRTRRVRAYRVRVWAAAAWFNLPQYARLRRARVS